MFVILVVLFTVVASCNDSLSVDKANSYILKKASNKDYLQPLVKNNDVFVVDKDKLICVDNKSGAQKWTYSFKYDILATPVTDGEFVYAVTPYELASIRIDSGREVWRKETTDKFISQVFYYKDNLYILGNERIYSIASKLENPKVTELESVGQVHINQILDFYTLISDKIGVVISYDTDIAFVVLYDNKVNAFSELVAIKLNDYNLLKLWSYDAKLEITSIISYNHATESIYFTTEDGSIHCLNVSDGSIRFSQKY